MIFIIGLVFLSTGYAAAVVSAYGYPEWSWLIIPLTVAGLLAFYIDCRDLRGLRRIGGKPIKQGEMFGIQWGDESQVWLAGSVVDIVL